MCLERELQEGRRGVCVYRESCRMQLAAEFITANTGRERNSFNSFRERDRGSNNMLSFWVCYTARASFSPSDMSGTIETDSETVLG